MKGIDDLISFAKGTYCCRSTMASMNHSNTCYDYSSLMVSLIEHVPLAARAQTKVFLQATAGLRSVTPEQAEVVLDIVRNFLQHSGFKFEPQWARIIDGQVITHLLPFLCCFI
jgi:hypothetical protein